MATPESIVVGTGGSIWIAPVGSTLPTNISGSLNAAFYDLGYISEDGISLASGADVTDIAAFQSLLPVRKVVTGRTFDLSFTVREWSAEAVVFAFGGGEIVENAGVYTFTPPAAGEALYERALVAEWVDGSKSYRLVIPRGVVSESVETTIARDAAADLPITFSVLATDEATPGYYLISDDPALAPAGS
jgi:hypothetical protein